MYTNERVTVNVIVWLCYGVSTGKYDGVDVNNRVLKISDFIEVTMVINFYDLYLADN